MAGEPMKLATKGSRAARRGERRADLLDAALRHDTTRSAMVMASIWSWVTKIRWAEPALQKLDLGAHLDPELGVEVRERLVEEEDLGLADEGAADGDALPLPAREVPRACGRGGDRGRGGARPRPRARDVALGAAHAQGVADVLAHGHVRVEGVVLEHHGDVAQTGAAVGDLARADAIRPALAVSRPATIRSVRGLAAARRADQDDELAVPHLEVEGRDDDGVAEALGHSLERDLGHALLAQSTRRAGGQRPAQPGGTAHARAVAVDRRPELRAHRVGEDVAVPAGGDVGVEPLDVGEAAGQHDDFGVDDVDDAGEAVG